MKQYRPSDHYSQQNSDHTIAYKSNFQTNHTVKLDEDTKNYRMLANYQFVFSRKFDGVWCRWNYWSLSSSSFGFKMRKASLLGCTQQCNATYYISIRCGYYLHLLGLNSYQLSLQCFDAFGSVTRRGSLKISFHKSHSFLGKPPGE